MGYYVDNKLIGEEDRGISMGMIVPNNPVYNKLLNLRGMWAF